LKFPENFLWGTATSPTQVEGHIVNEWTDYVAADGGHCRVACDHYHRYEEDVDWMARLGCSKKFGLLFVDFNDEKLPRKMTRVGEFYRGICTACPADTGPKKSVFAAR
jgi:beta-glucosidase/6-phospho-beta-glucosidase/beta-galactosidase